MLIAGGFSDPWEAFQMIWKRAPLAVIVKLSPFCGVIFPLIRGEYLLVIGGGLEFPIEGRSGPSPGIGEGLLGLGVGNEDGLLLRF